METTPALQPTLVGVLSSSTTSWSYRCAHAVTDKLCMCVGGGGVGGWGGGMERQPGSVLNASDNGM